MGGFLGVGGERERTLILNESLVVSASISTSRRARDAYFQCFSSLSFYMVMYSPSRWYTHTEKMD